MIYLGVFFTVLISFFLLFKLCKNEIVIVRQNISLQSFFDKAILVLLFSAFLARVFFIFENALFDYFNILKFFYIIRFPGFSITGFYFGMFLILGFIFRDKKNISRIYDLFFMSFYPFFMLLMVYIPSLPQWYFLKVFFVIIAIIFFFVLFKIHKTYWLKDGSIAIFQLVFVFGMIILTEIVAKGTIQRTLTFPHIANSIFFIIFLSLFIVNQKLVKKK